MNANGNAIGNAPAGFTPSKIALIAVLAFILVGTVIYQFTGTSGASPTYAKRAARTNGESSPTSSSSTATHNAAPILRAVGGKWPQISVAEASRFDPFAFPESMMPGHSRSAHPGQLLQPLQVESSEHSTSSASAELLGRETPTSGKSPPGESRPQEMKRRLQEQQAVAAELQRRGVGIIFQTAQGSVARLGDLEVRVGDVLNGLRVTEINADGIRLVPEDDAPN